MLSGPERREKILTALQDTEKPISASAFAKEFGVSRQIVVGDVALLRASGVEVIATARGYLIAGINEKKVSKIVVQHTRQETALELQTIVENGGEIIDVIVEHPLYGELTGQLHIENQAEVVDFITEYEKSNASLLSELTSGIHLHTIAYKEAEDLEKIKAALKKVGILYEAKEH
ncbi:transcription repressor NadR [Enterococcus alishanensis]|uniref:Transcription repressor NadR n=1 Tax=Enterococcus alishanensis TaxID=1303817 RepID=A0ABS6TEW7_9ENTE|nr:transcription repressor NadR [Enterococcus alishanensis]MBV7391402.1 transcription repressor NadR [Enterococcus alishanensis]